MRPEGLGSWRGRVLEPTVQTSSRPTISCKGLDALVEDPARRTRPNRLTNAGNLQISRFECDPKTTNRLHVEARGMLTTGYSPCNEKYAMPEQHLGPLISGDEIASELRRRKSRDQYQVVSAANKKLIAEKVKLEVDDGWRIAKKNKNSTRMAKPKPADEQLEDEVWCILAQMGFKEMSYRRGFTILEHEGLPPRQIDVFAKDDETVLIVECTQQETPGRKRMDKLIEKIKSFREPIRKSVISHYGREANLKIRFVIATRNIEWNEIDLQKAREADIVVISDDEIQYYARLVQLMKRAARYQLLAHMFEGKVAGLAREVVATRGRMGKQPFYTFLIRPDELLKIAYVSHKGSRNLEDLNTYQRMLVPSRLKSIAKYINDGGKFPTNIVVNIKTKGHSALKFDEIEKVGAETVGRLHLPSYYAAAWVIDGQHRLYGYAYARDDGGFKDDKTTIPVLAYENLSAEDEMNLFIDINSKQVKVSTSLLSEIHAELHWEADDPERAFVALLSRIAARLNSQKSSSLYERMAVAGKQNTTYRSLTITSVREGLRAAKLVGSLSKGHILTGPFSTPNPTDYKANLSKSIELLSDCLGLFASEMPDHWRLGSAPGGYLCTNIGIRALFHVFKDIADHVQHINGVDMRVLNAEDAFASMKPLLMELVSFFRGASAAEIQAFRDIGSSLSLVQQQAWGMESQIHKKRSEFLPSGLKEYLETRDEKGTEAAATKVRRINDRLFRYVIGVLKDHFGLSGDKWWTEGIPFPIRKNCVEEWEKKKREGTVESYLFLRDYVEISVSNWDLVKDVISLDAKDKMAKTKNVGWINELNLISQKTKHPEKGPLSVEQVARVNELYDLVQKYFPQEGVASLAVAG